MQFVFFKYLFSEIELHILTIKQHHRHRQQLSPRIKMIKSENEF